MVSTLLLMNGPAASSSFLLLLSSDGLLIYLKIYITGITYGKGASVLKQLVKVVTMDGFKAGMQYYFKTFAWKNTSIKDFMNAIEIGSKTDLSEWAAVWLETSGLNTIVPIWSVDETGHLSAFRIEQSSEKSEVLRPHRLECALFDTDAASDGSPVFRSSVTIDIKGPMTEVTQLVGEKAPSCLFLNHQDHAYAKIMIDEFSLKYMRAHIHQFPDVMLRQLIWSSIYSMVRDARWSSLEFLHLIRSSAPKENDAKITAFLISSAEGTLRSFVPPEFFLNESSEFFKLSIQQMKAVTTQDEQIMWARAAVGSANTEGHVQILLDMMRNGTGVLNFELDQDMRWAAVQRANAHGMKDAADLARKEEERDSSDRGTRAMERLRTCSPDPEVKAAAWSRFTDDTSTSLHSLRAAMGGFLWWHQQDTIDAYTSKFFDVVPRMFSSREFAMAEAFYDTLFPGAQFPGTVDGGQVLVACQRVLETLDVQKDTQLIRCLKESIDDLNRASGCYSCARKTQ